MHAPQLSTADSTHFRRYQEALDKFLSHPENEGFSLKLILSSLRVLDPSHIGEDAALAVKLKKANPDFVVGFDVVAEEDPNHRTLDYLDEIQAMQKLAADAGVDMSLYFHDGESDDRNNTNMIDAVLLGSKRVGHGFNSYFFPVLFEQMRQNNVVLEVNPISNQVLRYIDNLETHPVNA